MVSQASLYIILEIFEEVQEYNEEADLPVHPS